MADSTPPPHSPRRDMRGGGKAQGRDNEHFSDPLLERHAARGGAAPRARQVLLPRRGLARLLVAALVVLFLLLLLASVRGSGMIH